MRGASIVLFAIALTASTATAAPPATTTTPPPAVTGGPPASKTCTPSRTTPPGGAFLVRYWTGGGMVFFSETMTVDRRGGAVLLVARGKKLTRRFQLGAAALAALKSDLAAAHLATLAPCYGASYPDETSTIVETPARSIDVYEVVPGPRRLRPLLTRLASIAKAHGG
jgi:hypothetical protein